MKWSLIRAPTGRRPWLVLDDLCGGMSRSRPLRAVAGLVYLVVLLATVWRALGRLSHCRPIVIAPAVPAKEADRVSAAQPLPQGALLRGRKGRPLYVPAGTVAAIIPAHNEATVIEATLRSVLANYLPQDVYVFCDGCTDATAEIARRSLPQGNVIESTANLGKSRGMEHVLRAYIFPRDYHYVTTIDADTRLDEHFLVNSLTVLRQRNVACVVGQVRSRWYPKNLISVYRTYIYFLVFALLKRMQSLTNSISIASGCATTWKTRVLQQLDFDHQLSTEDIDLTIQVHRKHLGSIKYASSAIAWTQDPFTMGSFRRQTYRWNRAWWEAVRKHQLGARPMYRRGDGRFGVSVMDIATLLLMVDIIVLGIPALLVFPILLVHPVDLHLGVPFLNWGVDFNSRPAILYLLAWQYGWLLLTALIVALLNRQPLVFLYSPLFMALMYIEVALYVQAGLSTMRTLYLRRTPSDPAVGTSAWLSPERR